MSHRSPTEFKFHRRRYFISSDARIIMGDDEGALLRLWCKKQGEVEPKDLSDNLIVQLSVAAKDPNRRWYQAITGRMPAGLYIVAVCYATAVILLGWLPWNVLLILILLRGTNNRLRFRAFETRLRSSL